MGREALDKVTPGLPQQVSRAVEVDLWQMFHVLGATKRDEVLQLIGVIPLATAAPAYLPETPLGQPQHGVIAGQPLLEQRTYARQRWSYFSVRHDVHQAVAPGQRPLQGKPNPTPTSPRPGQGPYPAGRNYADRYSEANHDHDIDAQIRC